MDDSLTGIRIVIVNGSARPGNYTAMASALVAVEFRKNNVSVKMCVTSNRLPFTRRREGSGIEFQPSRNIGASAR